MVCPSNKTDGNEGLWLAALEGPVSCFHEAIVMCKQEWKWKKAWRAILNWLSREIKPSDHLHINIVVCELWK